MTRRLLDAALLLFVIANAHHVAVLGIRYLEARRRAVYHRH